MKRKSISFKRGKMSTFLYFGSSTPFFQLSNFNLAYIRITPTTVPPVLLQILPSIRDWVGEEVIFPSSEHYWQALKSNDKEMFLSFTVSGFFGQLTPYVMSLFSPETYQDEYNYWSQKNNVGIIAKLVANPKYCSVLNIKGRLDYSKEKMDPTLERSVWFFILREKFIQNPSHMKTLLSTQPLILIEYDKRADQNNSYWGGLVKNGVIVGNNQMGKYLMLLRLFLITEMNG